MGSCGRLIRISVIRLLNRGSVNPARDNGKAKAAGDVRTACKRIKAAVNAGRKVDGKARGNGAHKGEDSAAPTAVNAGRKVDNKAWGNWDHKEEDNEAPAAVRAAARPEILSFWLSTRTVMVNCRAAKSQMQPRRSRRLIRTATATSLATRCGPLIQVKGFAVQDVAARRRISRVLPRAIAARCRAVRASREPM